MTRDQGSWQVPASLLDVTRLNSLISLFKLSKSIRGLPRGQARPPTRGWQNRRGHDLLVRPLRCGADRTRTDDPRLAKPMLSQLSYSPEWLDTLSTGPVAQAATPAAAPLPTPQRRSAYDAGSRQPELLKDNSPVGQARLELATSPLSGVRSNHLSYWPCSSLFRAPPGRRTVKRRRPLGAPQSLQPTTTARTCSHVKDPCRPRAIPSVPKN